MTEMSPRSDTFLTWAGVGWFFRALAWNVPAFMFMPASWVHDVAVRRARRAMRHSEACFERRARAKP